MALKALQRIALDFGKMAIANAHFVNSKTNASNFQSEKIELFTKKLSKGLQKKKTNGFKLNFQDFVVLLFVLLKTYK